MMELEQRLAAARLRVDAAIHALRRKHHTGYRREHWADRNHYVFWFHDSTFECVAKSFSVERHRCSIGRAARGSLPTADPVIRSAARSL